MGGNVKKWHLGVSIALLAGSLLYLSYLLSVRGAVLSRAEMAAEDFPHCFEVGITDDGGIYNGKGDELTIDQFRDTMWELSEAYSNLQLKIQADKHVKYMDIADVMEAFAEAGCNNVVFDAGKCGTPQEFWIELPSCIYDGPAELPVEAWIEIGADGTVTVDGLLFDAGDVHLSDLVHHLRGMKYVAGSQGVGFCVNLRPSAKAVYERIVDVLSACAIAEVEHLTFFRSLDGDDE